MYGVISNRKKIVIGMILVMLTAVICSLYPMRVHAAGGLDMSTDYPGISAKAGDTVSFGLDFSADTSCDVSLSAESLPDGWSGYFKGSDSQISKVHVGADMPATDAATYYLTLPDDVTEGKYKVRLKADAGEGRSDILELEIKVDEQAEGQSSFTAEYPEQQGASGTSFSFDTSLVNSKSVEQSYSLSAESEDGWAVSFTPSGESSQVASITLDAGSSTTITVDVTPPETVEKGEYTIPVSAVSANDRLSIDLKVIVTGSYDVELTTPDGNLSFDAYANDEKEITLTVKNNGNVELTDLELSSSLPSNWEVRFEEETIESLAAGESKEVKAYVKPGSEAMTGDYMATLKVSNDETTSSAEFRVSVKTRTSWGIFAAAIILVLLAGLGYVIKKYGRR